MARFFIGAIIGLVLGGVLTFVIFVGVPRAESRPGEILQPPGEAGSPGATAQITLRQDFFSDVLQTLFTEMNPPAFPLGGANNGQPVQGGCQSLITIQREGSGVRTVLAFENDRVVAPLAFTGSYDSMFGCFEFTGWAQTSLELRYDAPAQKVFGVLNVESVNLDGVNPFLGGLITPIVQSTINSRVNPIQILDVRQVAVNMPIAASNANLTALVNDVRAEIKDNALSLFVTYDFSGGPFQPALPNASS